MKKLLMILLIITTQSIFANTEKDSLMVSQINLKTEIPEDYFCDACGCAAGNGSSGFESLLNPQFIGIKYFSQHYLAKENLFVQDLTQDQYFNTIQIWGKIPITEKLSVYGSIPYQFHEKKTIQGDLNISGIGDMNLMGIYQIINSKNTYHQLNGGLGVKIPTGKFDEKGTSGVNPSFQLGTGSWDYQMVLNYKFQKDKFAVLLNSDYTIKTENKKHYQFGNQFNYSATGFYQIIKTEKINLSVKSGFHGENYEANKQFGETLPKTLGNAFYGKLGFEFAYKKWSFGSEYFHPLHSNLAGGDLEAKSRLGIFFNYGI